VGEGEQRGRQRPPHGIDVDPPGEVGVELDDVGPQSQDVLEGVAGASVVHGDAHSLLTQGVERPEEGLVVVDAAVFGQFDHQALARRPGEEVMQRRHDRCRGGDVHRQERLAWQPVQSGQRGGDRGQLEFDAESHLGRLGEQSFGAGAART
jgi:hypothetical protein